MPSRQYAPKDFLRRTSNALLCEYFRQRSLLTHIDFSNLSETNVEPVSEALIKLPPHERVRVDGEFRLIHTVCDEEGCKAILEEARFHGEDLEPVFTSLKGHYDRALWTFLERPDYLDVAARFREADQRIGGTSWWNEPVFCNIRMLEYRRWQRGCRNLNGTMLSVPGLWLFWHAIRPIVVQAQPDS